MVYKLVQYNAIELFDYINNHYFSLKFIEASFISNFLGYVH
jgi:hypothetical protein